MPREMKDTGIEWIGKVPKDWDIVRLQYALSEILVKNDPIQTEEILSLTKDRGVIPYEDKGNQGNKSKTTLTDYKLAYPDTIVMNSMNVIIGSVGLSEYFGCVSPVYYVFKAKYNNEIRFFNYIFQTPIFQKELKKYANGILEIRLRVSSENVLKRKVALPNYEEQKKIADLLDKKCQEVEDIKETIEAEIKTLDEYKKSIITEAVTKGLDKGAEMKDSGIEWIGQIPKHWKVHRISKYFYEGKDKNILGKETNLLSLSYGNIIRKDINTLTGLLPENFNTYNIVEKGDIIIRPTDLQNDKKSLRTGLVKERGIITSAYIDLKPYIFTLSKYFHYLLHSYDLKKVFYNMGSGVRQGLNYSEFAKLLVMEPPINEQKAIADYLDHKTSAINEAIDGKRAQLVALDEYKKSIIYEYVTGKKEA